MKALDRPRAGADTHIRVLVLEDFAAGAAAPAGGMLPTAVDGGGDPAGQQSLAAAVGPLQQNGMGKTPAIYKGGERLFGPLVIEKSLADRFQSYTFSKRSTSTTKMVAPPTCTSMGMEVYIPTP